MKQYIALLRAVNVGGTGKLPMSELKRMCEEAGFENVRTYIQSGNVVLSSEMSAKEVKAALGAALHKHAGKPVAVFVRTPKEMQAILEASPYADREPRFSYVVFLDAAPPKDALKHATHVNDEEMQLGKREIYVFYGSGMGQSKLNIPAAKDGTARNMNTVSKLAAMAAE